MLPPQPQNLVHLFDYDSTGSYTITYGPIGHRADGDHPRRAWPPTPPRPP